MLNVILRNLKCLLNTILKRSLGILKSLLAPEFFCSQVNALWWGNSLYIYKWGQPALRASLRSARRARGRLTGQSKIYIYTFLSRTNKIIITP